MSEPASSDTSADVVVIGAGAAGLTAALAAARSGARVRLVEKGARLGGTAAVSGGIVWAPGNDRLEDPAGDRAAARDYFAAIEGGDLRADVLDGFIDHAGAAVRFVEAHSRLRFTSLAAYPDYYGDRPGATAEGRALDSGLFAFADLGPWRDRIATGTIYPLTVAETPLGGATAPPAADVIAARVASDARGFGQALVAGLLEACLAAGVDIRLGARVCRLDCGHGNMGLALADGSEIVAGGVVVATGGFEWDRDLTAAFLRGPIASPASPPGNVGDGLRLLMAAGAALGNMTSAWWCPTIATGETWDDGSPRAQPVLIERTLPGSIIVNAAGARFCNEAVNYSAIAGAFHAFDPNRYAYPNQPAWLMFGHDYKQRWPVAGAPPGDAVPDWMAAAPTLAALTEALGLPSGALEATVARFDGFAVEGCDPDFHRGEAAYDRFYGDRVRPGALATLGPVGDGPYYAVPLHLGVLGTNGGARTDAAARVLGHDGEPIPGLFAAGNVIACPTGGIYAGAGGTLGPAITFGYLAGRGAARANQGH